MMSKLTTFFDSERIFYPLAAIIAVLVPMYTVTVIINSYTLPPTVFPFFQWHGFEMIFTFFPTVLVGYLLRDYKNKISIFLLSMLWIIEQFIITFCESSNIVLSLITIYSISTIVLIKKSANSLSIIGLLSLVFLTRISYSFLELFQVTSFRYILYEGTLLLLSLICINLKNTKSKFSKLGYLVIFLGLVLQILTFYFPILNHTRASLHLWATGGLSLIMLDIILIQTYKRLNINVESSKLYSFLFYTLILGFLIRFLVPIINFDYFYRSLHHSMGFWTLAFLIYFIKFTPKLFKRAHK